MAEFETILTARNEMKQAIDAAIADVERLKRAQKSLAYEGGKPPLTEGQIKAISLGARNMGVTFDQQAAKFRTAFKGIKPAVDEAGNAVQGLGNNSRSALSGLDSYMSSMVTRYLGIGAAIAGATKSFTSFAASDSRMRMLAASIGTTSDRTAGLEKKFREIGNSIGRSTDEVADGFDKWRIRSGLTVEAALNSYPKVAAAAAVSGASVQEFGESFGVVVSNLKLTTEEIPTAINAFLHAKRVYGVEIQGMMRSLPELSKTFADMGYSGASGVALLASAVGALQPVFRNSMKSGQALTDILSDFGGTQLLDTMDSNVVMMRDHLKMLSEQGFDPMLEYLKMVDTVMQRNGGKWNDRLFPNPKLDSVRALRRLWEVLHSLPKEIRDSISTFDELNEMLKTGITGSPQQRIQVLANEFQHLAESFGALLDKLGATEQLKSIADELTRTANAIDKLEKSKLLGWLISGNAYNPSGDKEKGGLPGTYYLKKMLPKSFTDYMEGLSKSLDEQPAPEAKPGEFGVTPGALNTPPPTKTPEEIAAEQKRQAEYNSEAARIKRNAALLSGEASAIEKRQREIAAQGKKEQQKIDSTPAIISPAQSKEETKKIVEEAQSRPALQQAVRSLLLKIPGAKDLDAPAPAPDVPLPRPRPPAPAPAAKSFWQKFRDSASSPHRRMSFETPPGYNGDRAQQASMAISTGLPAIPSDPRYRNAIVGATIPLNSVRKRISGDAEDPEAPLRSALREMLGLPDPKEPAPWKPGGQWPHPDTTTDFSGSRRRATVLDEIMLKRQESQIKVTEDLVAEIRELNDLVKNGGGNLGGGGNTGAGGPGGGLGPGGNRSRLSGRYPSGSGGGGNAGNLPGLKGDSPYLSEAQGSAGRRGALNEQARAMLAGAGEATGVKVIVKSGTEVPGGFHSGTGRHSGGTADFELQDAKTGERIPIGSPKHLQFLEEAAKRGALGGGAAPGYMGNYMTDLSVSHGKGAGLYHGSPAMQEAFRRGRSQHATWLAQQQQQQQQTASVGSGTGSDLDRLQKAIQTQEGYRPGTRGWRNNNPGNVKALGPVGKALAAKYGATRVDEQGHIIFPSREAGLAAHRDFLQNKYHGKSLNQIAASGYAEDPNWGRGVARAGGIDPNQPLNLRGETRLAKRSVEPETWSDMGRGKIDEDRTVNVKVNYVREVGSDGHLSKAVTDQARRAWREQADDVLGNDLYV